MSKICSRASYRFYYIFIFYTHCNCILIRPNWVNIGYLF
nr:MAG TPA: hypothetical protein [Caudoviricetes sp.]